MGPAGGRRPALEQGLDEAEVFFGVDADGVEGGGFDVEGDAVFEEAELFEAFGLFEGAGGQGGEALEGGACGRRRGRGASSIAARGGRCRRGR